MEARIVIIVGHLGDQVKRYMELAHPGLPWTVVEDDDPRGPGASLLKARDAVEGAMVVTTCDTLWASGAIDWSCDRSWVGVAPMPAGTQPERWCRIHATDGVVDDIADKTNAPGDDWDVYTGLLCVAKADTERFWEALAVGEPVGGELQVTPGFAALGRLEARSTPRWTDVGDEDAYRAAVQLRSGYDWTKPGEATYVLPDEQRVVKWWADPNIARQRALRATSSIRRAVPPVQLHHNDMLAYVYIRGGTGYTLAEQWGDEVTRQLLRWADKVLWEDVPVPLDVARTACDEFYRGKTAKRVHMLHPLLQRRAFDILERVDWDALCVNVQPVTFHGDLNLGNVVVGQEVVPRFYGLDWRETFAGHTRWGDRRYDLAKLIGGTIIHWDNARRGDFRPWTEGPRHAHHVRGSRWYDPSVEIITGLTLLSSAPLHASPLDEILVSRACAHLEEVL